MADYKVDKKDLQFVLYELLDVEKLCELEPFSEFNREVFDMVLDEGVKLAEEQVAPINKVLDEQGCRFEQGKVILKKRVCVRSGTVLSQVSRPEANQ